MVFGLKPRLRSSTACPTATYDSGADRRVHLEQHAQTVAVFNRGVAGERQARFLAGAFAHELRLRVDGGLVRGVAAFLAFEVGPVVAAAGALVGALRLETLQRAHASISVASTLK